MLSESDLIPGAVICSTSLGRSAWFILAVTFEDHFKTTHIERCVNLTLAAFGDWSARRRLFAKDIVFRFKIDFSNDPQSFRSATDASDTSWWVRII